MLPCIRTSQIELEKKEPGLQSVLGTGADQLSMRRRSILTTRLTTNTTARGCRGQPIETHCPCVANSDAPSRTPCQRTGNAVGGQRSRGFESHPLRQLSKLASGEPLDGFVGRFLI